MQFDVNPLAISIEDQAKAIYHETLAGDVKKSVRKVSCPTIRLNSDYLTKAQRDQLSSMCNYVDTFLNFQMRDDLNIVMEINAYTDRSTVQLQNSSILRLEAVAQSLALPYYVITPTAVYGYNDPTGASTNYWSGGSYFGGGLITLGTPFPGFFDSSGYCFVNYSYKGWLVDMQKFSNSSKAGWLDRFNYDFVLTAV